MAMNQFIAMNQFMAMNQFNDPSKITVFGGGLSGYGTENELCSFF